MAHVISQTVTIKLSKLVKGDSDENLIPADFAEALEAVAGELVTDPSIIVEVEDGN